MVKVNREVMSSTALIAAIRINFQFFNSFYLEVVFISKGCIGLNERDFKISVKKQVTSYAELCFCKSFNNHVISPKEKPSIIFLQKTIRRRQLNFLLHGLNQLKISANQNNNTDFTYKHFFFLLFVFLLI